MHPRRLGFERGRLSRRQQAASPCPNRNGTAIGTAQSFTLFCGADIGGNTIFAQNSFDINTCADLCSSFHPRCDGVSFNGSSCELRARLSPGLVRGSRRSDSAVAIFPGASSNCASLGATTSALGSTFQVMCGTVVAGSDLTQNFAPTFQDCMGQCSATSGCAGVSFDASLDQGFKNCYLKTAVSDPSTIVPDSRVDTAMLQGGNTGSSVAAPGVSTIPLPTPAASTGLVFFTPPGATTSPSLGVGSLIPAQPTLVTDLLPPTATGITPTLFFPNVGSGGGTGLTASPPAGTNAQGNTDDATSNAWIAAPVVGSVAAIALIVLSFMMLKRRRLGQRAGTSYSNSSTDSLRPQKGNISRPMAISRLFSSWLPAMGRRNERGSSRSSASRSRMGNFSEVTGKQPASRGSMRTSVTGLVRPGLALGGGERLDDVEEGGEKRGSTPQYDVKGGKMELRNSMNGLGQNRWS